MALPTPVPGLVLRYGYLWHREHLEGRQEGQKDRPCAIVAAIRLTDGGKIEAVVLPITHTPPEDPDHAVELPPSVKKRLGLDHARSWVVTTEWNAFVWPGPDLRRRTGRDDGSVAYGMLPPKLFAAIRDRFLGFVRSKRGRPVTRS